MTQLCTRKPSREVCLTTATKLKIVKQNWNTLSTTILNNICYSANTTLNLDESLSQLQNLSFTGPLFQAKTPFLLKIQTNWWRHPSRSFFGKQNSTLGYVVPLAMFMHNSHLSKSIMTCWKNADLLHSFLMPLRPSERKNRVRKKYPTVPVWQIGEGGGVNSYLGNARVKGPIFKHTEWMVQKNWY